MHLGKSMHLVEKVAAERPVAQVGGFAGWVIGRVQELWSRGMMREGTRQMRLIETLSVGGRKHLMLVSCAGERFLVGVGQDGVQTITQVRSRSGASARTPGKGRLETS